MKHSIPIWSKLAIDSVDLVSDSVTVQVTYSIDQYLLLLGTYSPYLELEAESKERLFQKITLSETRYGYFHAVCRPMQVEAKLTRKLALS
jgi:hypothetical protein